MSFSFPTAKNVTVAIDGYHIDLAFRMDWKEDQPKIPRYGYNDYEFSRVIPGRKIIQGFLVINFVAPNYLGAIVENKIQSASDKTEKTMNEFLGGLPGVETAASRKARAEQLAGILFPPNEDLISTRKAQQTKRYNVGYHRDYGQINYGEAPKSGPIDPSNQIEEQGPNPLIPANNNQFRDALISRFVDGERVVRVPYMASPLASKLIQTMDVYYHDADTTPWYMKFYGVHFTNVSQSYSAAGADGSAEPIYETYEFIASRRSGKLNGGPTSSKNQ